MVVVSHLDLPNVFGSVVCSCSHVVNSAILSLSPAGLCHLVNHLMDSATPAMSSSSPHQLAALMVIMTPVMTRGFSLSLTVHILCVILTHTYPYVSVERRADAEHLEAATYSC